MEKEIQVAVSGKTSKTVSELARDKAYHTKTTVSKEIDKFLKRYTKGWKIKPKQ